MADIVRATDGDAIASIAQRAVCAPSDAEVEAINRKIARKVLAWCAHLDDNDTTLLSDDGAALATGYAEALQPWLPGTQAANDPVRLRQRRRCSLVDGFSLHADVHAPAGDHRRLERLCRYGLRPPFALERMEPASAGRIAYRMKRRTADGATHRIFTRLEFLAALVALIPPPRGHLTRYHGVFAPSARDRGQILPAARAEAQAHAPSSRGATGAARVPHRLPWGELLKKVFAVDVFTCDRCGGHDRARRAFKALTPRAIVRALLIR